MSLEIHPLQKTAIALLDQLYRIDGLAPTQAMHQVLCQKVYPGLKDILETLDAYKDNEKVISFVSCHSEQIIDAKNLIERSSCANFVENDGSNAKDKPSFGSDFFNRMTVFEMLKTKPLSDLEKAFSSQISSLYGEESNLTVEIIKIDNDESHWLGSSSVIMLRIKD